MRRSRVLLAAGAGLCVALALLVAACGSGGSATLPTVATGATTLTTSALPPTTMVLSTSTTAPAATTTAPAATTTAPGAPPIPATTTTLQPVTLPGGVVIRSFYEVVEAKGDLHVAATAGGAVDRTFPHVNELDAVTSMLTVTPPDPWGAQGWLEVMLPCRPNGSVGWVEGDEVSPSLVTTAVVVELSAHRLTLYDQARKVASYTVAVGTSTNPTPTGSFFVTGVLRPDPGGAYGPYAIGTSAFSDTLTDWPGGGVVGIHGTNVPSSIGKSASHGCVRLRNDDITKLAPAVSLGTPVFILP